MVIWRPNPYVICPRCNRANYLKGVNDPGQLCLTPESEFVECSGCQYSQSYRQEDMLPIIPERTESKRWGYGRYSGCYSVYLIVNTSNGLVYVGRTTKTLFERMSQHEACSRRRSTRFAIAMAEFGFKAFDMILLEEAFYRWDHYEDRECCWIDRLDARNPLKGYNLA